MNTERGVVFWTAFNFVEANNEAASNQSRPGNGLFFLSRLNPQSVISLLVCAYIYSHSDLGNVLKVHAPNTIATETKCMQYNFKEKSRYLKCFPQFSRQQLLTRSPALLFTMTDLKHSIQIGSGRCKRSLHLL